MPHVSASVYAVLAVLSAMPVCWHLLKVGDRFFAKGLQWAAGDPLGDIQLFAHRSILAGKKNDYLLSGVMFLIGMLVMQAWLFAVLAAVAGIFGIRFLRRYYNQRQAAALAALAPVVAQSLADALAAGHTLIGAFDRVIMELEKAGTAHPQLVKLRKKLLFGYQFDESLNSFAQQTADPTWATIIAAVLLHSRVGGDLVGLLREVADELDGAQRVRREAQAATTQARFTAALVVGLPCFGLVLAELAQPGFLLVLLAQPISLILCLMAIFLQVTAGLLIRSLLRQPRERLQRQRQKTLHKRTSARLLAREDFSQMGV